LNINSEDLSQSVVVEIGDEETSVFEMKKSEKLSKTLFLICDCETTGFSKDDLIVEFAAVDLNSQEKKLWRIKNETKDGKTINISVGAINTHGIRDENLKNAPKFGDVMKEFKQWVERFEANNVILAFHNLNFDYRFIFRGFADWGIQIPESWIFGCTLTVCQNLW